MKKARIVLSLVLALSLFTFVGCGDDATDDNVTDETTVVETTIEETTGTDELESLGDDVKDDLDPNATTESTTTK